MTEPSDVRDFLSRSEVAEIFNVSPNTITRWAEAGKIPCIRTLGGHRRYEKHAIGQLARIYFKEADQVEATYLFVPQMYADHCVQSVRELLLELPGVQNVCASPAFQHVKVMYNPESIAVEEIVQRLEHAGYAAVSGQIPAERVAHHRDPAWNTLGLRMTRTHCADR